MGKVIIISGPTASGKTSTAIAAALDLHSKGLKCSVVNFDSLLFYKGLNIGTAKPTEQECAGVPHHLIDITEPTTDFNAAHYINLAKEKISQLHKNNEIVILVGGSAFYLRALLKGMYDDDQVEDEKTKLIKETIDKEYKEKGIGPIIDKLKSIDPKSVANLHQNDHYRLIRAYEFYKITGKPISIQKEKMDKSDPYDFSTHIHKDWDILHVYLDLPKEEHYQYILKRTQTMFNEGLVKEVKELLNSGLTGREKSMKSIGYKETIQYLNGDFSDEAAYLERISISTRQLAKSQRTFFKKITPKKDFHPLENRQEILSTIASFAIQKD